VALNLEELLGIGGPDLSQDTGQGDLNVDTNDPVHPILEGTHTDPTNPADPGQGSQVAALGWFGVAFVGTVAVGAAVGIYRMVTS
jgi:hypothetical protein